MTEALRATVDQAAVDRYLAMYPVDGPHDIAAWKRDGTLVIVDEKKQGELLHEGNPVNPR
jgi:hypothetical protein